jgi:hypothetical protein
MVRCTGRNVARRGKEPRPAGYDLDFMLCNEEVMFGRPDFEYRPYSLEVPCLLPLMFNFD